VKKLEIILTHWRKALAQMSELEGFQRIASGDLTMAHYVSILTQIYFQVREHPQALAAMTLNIPPTKGKMIKAILKHALSETGHDQLALDDIKTLGFDIHNIPHGKPNAATQKMLDFMREKLRLENGVSYLGYLFHLEFLPTQMGWQYIKSLKKIGIPDRATTFIREHAEIDVAHNRLMEAYIDELIHSKEDLKNFIITAQTAALLYGNMITQAIKDTDEQLNQGNHYGNQSR